MEITKPKDLLDSPLTSFINLDLSINVKQEPNPLPIRHIKEIVLGFN
jgi:hypothetical protein